MPINKNQMIEYIIYLLDKQFSPQELFNIFKRRDIYINDLLYTDLIQLKHFYVQVIKAYNNSALLNQFINATRRSIQEGKQQSFKDFKDANILNSFYSLFLILVNGASTGVYDDVQTRDQILIRLLGDLHVYTLKYDYYLKDKLKIVFKIPDTAIIGFHILPSQTKMFVETRDDYIAALDINNGNIISQTRLDSNLSTIFKSFLSRDGIDRVAVSSTSIKIWNPDDGKYLLEIPQNEATVMEIMISENNVPLLVVGTFDGDIVIWNTETGSKIRTIKYIDEKVRPGFIMNSKSVSHLLIDKHKIIVGYYNGIVKIFDYENSLVNDSYYGNNNYISSLYKISEDKIVFRVARGNGILWNPYTQVSINLKPGFERFSSDITRKLIIRGDDILILTDKGSIEIFDFNGYRKSKMDGYGFKIQNIDLIPNNDIILFGNKTLLLMDNYRPKNLKMDGNNGQVLSDGTIAFHINNYHDPKDGIIENYE